MPSMAPEVGSGWAGTAWFPSKIPSADSGPPHQEVNVQSHPTAPVTRAQLPELAARAEALAADVRHGGAVWSHALCTTRRPDSRRGPAVRRPDPPDATIRHLRQHSAEVRLHAH